jgi:hypothetical protein
MIVLKIPGGSDPDEAAWAYRAHRGIDDGGQRALVFPHLGQHDVAERHRHAGQDLGGQLAHTLLMRAVKIGVHQANGQRLDALRHELLQLAADVRVVDGVL